MIDLFGPDPKPPRDYKAPHANRGTPPRPRRGKVTEMVFSKAHDALIPRRRPFKGHRI